MERDCDEMVEDGRDWARTEIESGVAGGGEQAGQIKRDGQKLKFSIYSCYVNGWGEILIISHLD